MTCNDQEKAVNAYVTFRSMEGRERIINSYRHGCCARFLLCRCFCCNKKEREKL